MSEITVLLKRVVKQKHFYFWLTLPITIIVVIVFIDLLFLLRTYDRSHTVKLENYIATIIFQVLALTYIVYLQRMLWFGKNTTALIIFAIVGLLLFPVSAPLEILIFLLLTIVTYIKNKKIHITKPSLNR